MLILDLPKQQCSWIFLSVIFLFSFPSCKSPDTNIEQINLHSCQPWAEIRSNALLLTNNIWGARNFPDFKQCIAAKTDHSGIVYSWNWSWHGKNGQVKSYPSLCFGHKPWNKHSTTEKLPILLTAINSLLVEYNIKTTGSSIYNILLESWITSTAIPRPDTRVAELAILLDEHDWPGMPGHFVETVTIDGQNFDFYMEPRMVVPDDSNTWIYLGFVAKEESANATSKLHGQIDIAKFIRYLVAKKYIRGSQYLSSVELGNEVISGEGKTFVKDFHVSIRR